MGGRGTDCVWEGGAPIACGSEGGGGGGLIACGRAGN